MAPPRFISFLSMILAFSAFLTGLQAQSFNELLSEAQAWQLRGKPEQAIPLLESLLANSPDDVTRWHTQRQYTMALVAAGRDSSAGIAAQQLLRMHPRYRPDALNDPPAYTELFRGFSVHPDWAFHLQAGIGTSSAKAYRTFRPADYDKIYSAVPAFALAAGLSHSFSQNLTMEALLEYTRSGFDHTYALSDWSQFKVRERADMLAVPLALRLGPDPVRGRQWYIRAGLTPGLVLDVRTDYSRSFGAFPGQRTELLHSRSADRRQTFQLAWHTGIGLQQSSSKGRMGLQITAQYWQTPWVKPATRFMAPDISYAFFHYDDDLRRMDLGIRFFTERTIHWGIRKKPYDGRVTAPWRMWMDAPSSLAGTAAEQQLVQGNNWLARGEFRRLSDSVTGWLGGRNPEAAPLLRLQMLAQDAMGDSAGTAHAIQELLKRQPDYLRFPGGDPATVQKQLSRYRILHPIETGFQAGALLPFIRIQAYHSVANAPYHSFTPAAGYTAGASLGHQFSPSMRIQTGLQLLGFGYSSHNDNANQWQQQYRERLLYAGIPLRLQWNVPERNLGLVLAGSAAWLLQANSEIILNNPDGGISRNTMNNFADRKPFQWSWGGGVFQRIPAGDAYLQLECLWMQYTDIFNRPETRYRRTSYRLDYDYVDSDLQFGTLQFNLAYVLPLSYRSCFMPAR